MSDHHDPVVVKDSGSSAGIVLGAIVLVLALVIGWYLFLGPGAGAQDTPGDIDVNVELPSVAPDAS